MSRLTPFHHENLTDSVISKLFDKGIYTVYDFIKKATDVLIKNTGLSFKEIVEIKNKLCVLYEGCKMMHAPESVETDVIISSRVVSLDKLLDGGFHSKYIYEFFGASSSGKSQLCMTIATRISLENQIVHYIDTKGDFSVLRVEQMLIAQKCSNEVIATVLQNIKVTTATSANSLFSILHYLGNLSKDEFNTKLIIIDSLSTFCLASTISSDSTCSLNHLHNMLRYIVFEYNIPIITTNLVTKWNEENGTSFKDGVNTTIFKPTLGKYWFNGPSTRLLLERVKNEERRISVWQSHELLICTDCIVNISDAGVC